MGPGPGLLAARQHWPGPTVGSDGSPRPRGVRLPRLGLRSASAPGARGAIHVPPVLAGSDVLAAVTLALAGRDREADLRDAALVKMNRDGHERQALLLYLGAEPVEFPGVYEQFPAAYGSMFCRGRVAVGSDMTTDEPELIAFDERVGLIERCRAVPQALDFGAGKHDTTLDLVEQLVPKRGLPIPANGAVGRSGLGHNKVSHNGLHLGFSVRGRQVGRGILRRAWRIASRVSRVQHVADV